MGYGTYSDVAHIANTSLKASLGYDINSLKHTDDIKHGRAAAMVNQRLDPRGLKIRESRDSADHPNSLAIMVFFDVTGSMGSIPKVLRKKLNNLMGLLQSRGYVADPQILFGAIGDATCDAAPLQVGQFESDIKMDDDLEAVWVESGGGGQNTESYELAYYVASRHTNIDCFEKRGHKGYVFTIGDEMPYDVVDRKQIVNLIGSGAQKNIPTEEIIKEAQEKFHCFHLIAARGSAGSDPTVRMRWKLLLGDHAVIVEEMDFIAETIALIVGMYEGAVDLKTAKEHLKDLGVSTNIIAVIEKALEPVEKRAIAFGGLKVGA